MGFQVFVHLILVFAIRGVVAAIGEVREECRTMRCSNHGPEIRFPFQLKDRQPEHCGLPGFQIFCHRGKASMEFQFLENTSLPGIQLFTTQEVHVLYLDYEWKRIDYKIINSKLKLVHALTSLSSAIAPFHLLTKFDDNATCVSCSSRVATKLYPPAKMVTSLSRQSFPVYCFLNSLNISQLSITSCAMVFSSSIPHIDDPLNGLKRYGNYWLGPNCGKCEAKGEYCKLKNSSISNIEPADNSTICLPRGRGKDSIKPIAGWHPVDRPSMKHVIQMLESQECPTMPPNPFGTSSARSFTNDLEVIFESE
ncbi:hypothetical protein POM88_031558 [Heracleum sosnowskyi]|uniref:RING-type E3 ubiquitin transferase n=1 Tax=Heracleum sosnowskyi TaxID=360622 RepID=A0AAD8HYA8_9APIA|nr:hypothetical protein POM88_031558 [Heracleum sosnowskyi]